VWPSDGASGINVGEGLWPLCHPQIYVQLIFRRAISDVSTVIRFAQAVREEATGDRRPCLFRTITRDRTACMAERLPSLMIAFW
jgi:hypothetical protein